MIEPQNNGVNYGINLLRVVSMIFICVVHVLGHGGVIAAAGFLSVNYCVAILLQVSVLCAVNCYALISGYVGVDAKYKASNLVYLWVQAAFYSVVITVIFAIVKPEYSGGDVTGEILKSFLPVTSCGYWYFTAYFGLFLLMPILNFAIKTMPRIYLKWVLILLAGVISVFTAINADCFEINAGFSTLWLAVLYLFGGYVKKYGIFSDKRNATLICYILISVLITWGVKMIFDIVSGETEHVSTGANPTYEYGYTSPTVLLISVVMLKLFSGITFKKPPKLSEFFSRVSFGVYLIHEHPLIKNYVIAEMFVRFSSFNVVFMVLCVIGSGLVLFLICSVIDYIRLTLFGVLKLKRRFIAIENHILGKMMKREEYEKHA